MSERGFCGKIGILHCTKHDFFIAFSNIKRVHWDSLARIQKTHFYILF